MSAKQAVLDAVGAMPDGASWQDVLARIETLVARGPMGTNGSILDGNARLTRRLYPTTEEEQRALEADLDAMAADADMQKELRRINEEFACTDSDGLEGL